MRKKRLRNRKTFIWITVIIIMLVFIKIIPMIYCYYTKFYSSENDFIGNRKINSEEIKELVNYSITDLIDAITNNELKIEYVTDQDCVYTDKVKITISNLQQEIGYNIQYIINDGEIKRLQIDGSTIQYEIIVDNLQQGKNKINIVIQDDSKILKEEEKEIYYVEPYKKQFLEELESNGVQVHYKDPNLENCEYDISLLKSLGVNYVRAGFTWELIEKEEGKYDFSYYDIWMDKLKENNIKVIANIGTSSTKYIGNDRKFSSEEEIAEFVEFIEKVQEHYEYIEDYEILNEPNYNSYGYLYKTEEQVKWYYKLAEETKNALLGKNPNLSINIGSLSIDRVETNNNISPVNFLSMIKDNVYKNFNEISIHPYDWFNYTTPNLTLRKNMEPVKSLFNDMGGFLTINATEYGATSYNALDLNEEVQAGKIVQQSVLLEGYNINDKVIYNFWNMGTDINEREDNFGLITNAYKPKKAYYAMKNYYENTNGSEYIGTINLADGLETHVYDKDGKPKIITWSNTKDQTIQIDYADFTAKDLYGNDIENTNGKLDITTSPVYLDNISTKYFYEAISNTALEKYSEFEEKFATEIASVEGLQENINTLKQYLESISNIENEPEETAKQKMKKHFNLGNQILTAYKEEKLNVEYVKLSSMLDMLNEIGDSFEDLVTVTATTRNPDLENTKNIIDNTEQLINNNTDLEIVYPTKILDFSKDLYEDSEYINNLEEENDIKTGLIVSYDLHAKYLADWANTFTNLYIDKYIEDNPVTESYSATSLTNQDVIATLNISQDVKITNNEGNNTYTFTENGTFTFEYERRGKTANKLVSVNYIDKTSPEITNVENGGIYTQSVNPNASDEHLDKVQLTFRGQVIEDYELGEELTEEGDYKLIATDAVGNTSTVKFYIMKEYSTYKIKYSNILNIKPETTVKDFKENFTVIEGYTIKREDTELTNEDIISTGDILEETDGNKFTLIVRGDLNCDGRLSIVDLSIERKYLLEIIDIDENQKLSSDMNIDEETSLMDLSIMRKTLLGIIE